MTVQVMVTVVQNLGLVMDLKTVKIRHMAVTSLVIIMMMVIVVVHSHTVGMELVIAMKTPVIVLLIVVLNPIVQKLLVVIT